MEMFSPESGFSDNFVLKVGESKLFYFMYVTSLNASETILSRKSNNFARSVYLLCWSLKPAWALKRATTDKSSAEKLRCPWKWMETLVSLRTTLTLSGRWFGLLVEIIQLRLLTWCLLLIRGCVDINSTDVVNVLCVWWINIHIRKTKITYNFI